MDGVIRDQRSMHGFVLLPTPETVRAAWERFPRTRGWPGFWINRIGDDWNSPALRWRTDEPALPARISAGRWVADCPCGCGIAGWPEHELGCCYECGTVWTLGYPDPDEIRVAVAALAARPRRGLMHWDPAEQPPHELEVENLMLDLPARVG